MGIRFDYDGKIYLQMGCLQLRDAGMSEPPWYAEPVKLKDDVTRWVDEDEQVSYGENALTGMPTFVFMEQAAFDNFVEHFNVPWSWSK